MIKPFRLINSLELKQLEDRFNQTIEQWNHSYALHSLMMQLALPTKKYSIPKGVGILVDNQLTAIIEGHYSTLFNFILFGTQHNELSSVSQELMDILLSQLLGKEQCTIEKISSPVPDWIYRGSTCLILTLSHNEHQLNLTLNPDWVYSQLGPVQSQSMSVCTLDRALEEQQLGINLELAPFKLPIKQLLSIQPGDVLLTDHALNMPLRIIQKDQLLAEAELGQSGEHKSILLKRSS